MCDPKWGVSREGQGDRLGPKKVVRFVTYITWSRRNGGLEPELHGLAQ